MKQPQRGRWFDVGVTALAPAMWGSTYLVTTRYLPPDHPFTTALLRVLPAGVLLLLLTRLVPKPQHWGRLLALSALNIGVFQALLFVAAYRLPGGLAAVLGAIQPLIVLGLNLLVDKHKPSFAVVFACCCSIVGMVMLLVSPQTVWDGIGIGAALLGAACMAFGTWCGRRWRLDMPVLALTGWQLLLGGLMLAPLAFLTESALPALDWRQIAAYSYLSLAGAMLAYVVWFRGVARLPAVAVASLGLISPITAVLLGWFALQQTLSGSALLGMVMVLSSVLAVQWLAMKPSARDTKV